MSANARHRGDRSSASPTSDAPSPITEASNPLSAQLDCGTALDLVEALAAVDDELFYGPSPAFWSSNSSATSSSSSSDPLLFPHVRSSGILRRCAELSSLIADCLRSIDNTSTPTTPTPTPTSTPTTTTTTAPTTLTAPTTTTAAASSRTGIVFTGCGTSGRIAFLCARAFNRQLRAAARPPTAECFHYLIAGGDQSLVLSQELPEDDPNAGVRDLTALLDARRRRTEESLPTHAGSTKARADDTTHTSLNVAATQQFDRWILVGITCGLSAPYVMSQVQYALDDPERFVGVALMGFNQASMARNVPVEGWSLTCSDVVQAVVRAEMENSTRSQQVFLINPAVGPEAVTGSSRMKGGSMTLILLHLCCGKAIADLLGEPCQVVKEDTDGPELVGKNHTLLALLKSFELASRAVYAQKKSIALAVEAAAHSLRNDGHVYYVGDGSLGLLGMIDSSEMYDTYGLHFLTVRGFLNGGWTAAEIASGDLTEEGTLFRVDISHFVEEIMPELTTNDTVVFSCLGSHTEHPKLFELASRLQADECCKVFVFAFVDRSGDINSIATTTTITTQTTTPAIDISGSRARQVLLSSVELPLSCSVRSLSSYAQLAAKLVFNAITTGAAVFKGLVLGNTMINLGISNNKLFHRAAATIMRFCKVSEDQAHTALLRAIYDCDQVSKQIRAQPISAHLVVATPKPQVLPLALLLCGSSTIACSVAEARQQLAAQPMVRRALQAALLSKGT